MQRSAVKIKFVKGKMVVNTLEDLLLFSRNIFFWGNTKWYSKTTIPRHDIMFFYVSKMAVAIAFLYKKTVEAIKICFILVHLPLCEVRREQNLLKIISFIGYISCINCRLIKELIFKKYFIEYLVGSVRQISFLSLWIHK